MSSDAKSAVFKYLRDQNRPYSVNDIMLNLHKEHGKAAIQKGIDLLVCDGKIIEKVFSPVSFNLKGKILKEKFSNYVGQWKAKGLCCKPGWSFRLIL